MGLIILVILILLLVGGFPAWQHKPNGIIQNLVFIVSVIGAIQAVFHSQYAGAADQLPTILLEITCCMPIKLHG